MIAQSFAVLLLVGVAYANIDFATVDPNSLQCDPKGQVFLLLPHFEHCNKFYMCANGKEVEFTCAKGTIFDFRLQTCNWPWATKCYLRETEEGSGSGEESGDFEWLASEDTQPHSDIIAPSSGQVRIMSEKEDESSSAFAAILDCSNPANAVKQLPYKGDCQRYWRCVNGLHQSAYCSDGLFFNEKTQQCDFEANVKCDVTHEYELEGEFMVYK